ncbi:MAG TPA: hypothetical protein VG432_04885, partial [Gemmatimonadaceae bacterium]|nr:hypothetical protein [Gemmatimonadaceae bacterium]
MAEPNPYRDADGEVTGGDAGSGGAAGSTTRIESNGAQPYAPPPERGERVERGEGEGNGGRDGADQGSAQGDALPQQRDEPRRDEQSPRDTNAGGGGGGGGG